MNMVGAFSEIGPEIRRLVAAEDFLIVDGKPMSEREWLDHPDVIPDLGLEKTS